MDKLKMESKDILNENIVKIADLFPNCIVESEDGKKIDFDLLRQELSGDIVDGPRERYHLDFPGKREAIVESNRKITKTLRPIKDKSVNFDTTKNIYIEGDNLEALKILQESYLGKIKCIYIDPPYNTGNDFVYNDSFSHEDKEEQLKQGRIDKDGNVLISNKLNNETSGRYHSDWLKMMYPRLKLARNLLSDDGVIFISIDDNEVDNLRKLCDEIFAEKNFVACLAIENNPKGRKNGKYFAINHENCMVYVKDYILCKSFQDVIPKEGLLEDEEGFYSPGQRVLVGKCSNKVCNDINSEKYYYVYYKEGQQLEIRKKIDSDLKLYKLYISKNDNGEIIENTYTADKLRELYNQNSLIFKDDTIYEKDRNTHKQLKTLVVSSVHYDLKTESANFIDDKFDLKKIFNMPKNVDYIRMLLKLNTDKNDIILDFFSGSATTAHAVMKLNSEDGGNRQFIMIQLPEATDENSEAYKAGFKNICDIGEERIRRAGKKILEELKNNVGAKLASPLDIGFRVYKIDDSNMKDVYYKPNEIDQKSVLDYISNVKEDRTALDLLTQVMLNLGLTLDLKIEEKKIDKNLFYFVEDNALVACFDEKINLDSLSKALECKPLKIVCKESSFEKDQDKINFNERIKKHSPETEKYII